MPKAVKLKFKYVCMPCGTATNDPQVACPECRKYSWERTAIQGIINEEGELIEPSISAWKRAMHNVTDTERNNRALPYTYMSYAEYVNLCILKNKII
jgi:predicted ATP-dependent serine protease